MRYAGDEPDVRTGGSALPGVTLLWTVAEAAPGRSPKELRERLRAAADRMTGAQALALRHRDVVHAYRVFFRRIGIDPDERPTPAEAIALRRMRHGALLSRGLVEDALTVATLETAVPLCALDADRLTGDLGVEATAPPVLADRAGAVAVLFEPAAARAAIGPATRRIALAAVGVPGVPRLSVEEALWTAWDTLA
jgi:hypothetical protein